MLKKLSIRNLAVIESVDLDSADGFTVLTGETGAGKSILIDAIGLILGDRADPALVRSGCERAEVTAHFELAPDAPVLAILRTQALDDPDSPNDLLIRRVVQTAGRARAFVNGVAVTANQLRELGEQLVLVFGQSESLTLLRADVQRTLLDDFGGHQQLLDTLADRVGQIQNIDAQMDALRNAAERDPAQLDYLRFQVQELDALQFSVEELEQLDIDQRQLANAGRILSEGGQVQDRLYGGDDSIYDQLSTVYGALDALAPLHPEFAEAASLIATAQAQAEEAANTVRAVLERLDLDPEHLQQVEQRLAAIHDLARKHRVKPAELPELRVSMQAQLDAVGDSAEALDRLQRQQDKLLEEYRTIAAELTARRRKSATGFAAEITRLVRRLGMPKAQFAVEVDPADPATVVRATGADDIRFDFSANPGQSLRPLARVASGGELSRISLAVEVVSLRSSQAPTMIFDEVDAGISGAVAEIVGQTLRALGRERQVLCVTHLAQVAAQGHHHYAIRKVVRNGQTFTQVLPVDGTQRIEELARIQGGIEISEVALAHARELLDRAQHVAD